MRHLMLMDDPWSIDQEMTVAKWDLDPIKGCSRKTRSRDQVFDPVVWLMIRLIKVDFPYISDPNNIYTSRPSRYLSINSNRSSRSFPRLALVKASSTGRSPCLLALLAHPIF